MLDREQILAMSPEDFRSWWDFEGQEAYEKSILNTIPGLTFRDIFEFHAFWNPIVLKFWDHFMAGDKNGSL